MPTCALPFSPALLSARDHFVQHFGMKAFLSFIIIMLSSYTRAFFISHRMVPHALSFRLYSSADTTVVDVCKQKIQLALQAVDVKVTGTCDGEICARQCTIHYHFWLVVTLGLSSALWTPFSQSLPNFAFVGAYDDPNGSHISIEVVSPLFEGKRPVQRQQLVYKAIWEELQGRVHAVDAMVCKSPSEI